MNKEELNKFIENAAKYSQKSYKEYGTINWLKLIYTQEEVENAIRGHILRFNEWIDELSEKRCGELEQILYESFNEIKKENQYENNII